MQIKKFKLQMLIQNYKKYEVHSSTLKLSDFIIQNYTRISFKWDSTGNVFINTKKKILGLLLSHVMWRTTPLLWWLNLLMSSFTLITSDFFISIIIICIIFTKVLICWQDWLGMLLLSCSLVGFLLAILALSILFLISSSVLFVV